MSWSVRVEVKLKLQQRHPPSTLLPSTEYNCKIATSNCRVKRAARQRGASRIRLRKLEELKLEDFSQMWIRPIGITYTLMLQLY